MCFPVHLTATEITDQKTIDAARSFQQCREIVTDKERLNCYDITARRFAPPTYKGRLGTITEPFDIQTPHRLRFRSSGVIFVLYLRDENGEVLQNLHIGGQGEDEYIIREPGRYSLKIHGSAGWEIWLEPLESNT
ncbi:MAG: hypothetical protein MI673_05370 [Thiotrichales bacterium]|nr:hypothetical protein [Thiotrichales bacterium]